jgi:hypothetical protein
MHLSARRWLNKLHDDVGAAGLAAAAALPGLSATVDQHAAAVRDATTLGLETTADPTAWRTADWTSLRLAAVCALAQTRHDTPPTHRHSVPGDDRRPHLT